MKKLFYVTALALGFAFTANAQAETAKAQTTATTETTTQQPKEYKKIDRKTVAADALTKIGTKFGGYSILEAHQAADGEYKLVLTKDGKNTTAYFTAAGDFIRQE